MAKPIIAVIDGDEIAFKIAAACETRSIRVTNKLNERESEFKTRTEFKKFLLDYPDADISQFEIEDVQVAEDIANALHSVKVRIESIKKSCKADLVEVYLSGKDNFRDKLPLPTKYKSSRDDTIKPLLLPEVRAYIQKKYKAVIVNGQETDDVVCHRMYDGYISGQKIVGVTEDKDARGNMGWLLNPAKMSEPKYIDGLGELWIETKIKEVKGKPKKEETVRGEGRKWGYLQWICGDGCDDYKPSEIAKIAYGEKSAYKLLHPLNTDQECVQAVYNLYKTWYPDVVEYTSWAGEKIVTDAIGIMQLYFSCYWMKRYKDDYPKVVDILNNLEIKL